MKIIKSFDDTIVGNIVIMSMILSFAIPLFLLFPLACYASFSDILIIRDCGMASIIGTISGLLFLGAYKILVYVYSTGMSAKDSVEVKDE